MSEREQLSARTRANRMHGSDGSRSLSTAASPSLLMWVSRSRGESKRGEARRGAHRRVESNFESSNGRAGEDRPSVAAVVQWPQLHRARERLTNRAAAAAAAVAACGVAWRGVAWSGASKCQGAARRVAVSRQKKARHWSRTIHSTGSCAMPMPMRACPSMNGVSHDWHVMPSWPACEDRHECALQERVRRQLRVQLSTRRCDIDAMRS